MNRPTALRLAYAGNRGRVAGSCTRRSKQGGLEGISAESFANAMEALGSAFRHMPGSDSGFYQLNSYLRPAEKRTELLDKTGAAMGAELRFTLLFFPYFEANLATQPPTDSVHGRITETGGVTLSRPFSRARLSIWDSN